MLDINLRLEALRMADSTDGTPEDTVSRAQAYLDFLQGNEQSANEQSAKEPASKPATRSRKPENKEPTEGNSDAAATSSEKQSSAADKGEITEADLRARATQYAAKAGPTALVEMQKGAGAPNGKISEVIGNTDRMQALSDALAAAGY